MTGHLHRDPHCEEMAATATVSGCASSRGSLQLREDWCSMRRLSALMTACTKNGRQVYFPNGEVRMAQWIAGRFMHKSRLVVVAALLVSSWPLARVSALLGTYIQPSLPPRQHPPPHPQSSKCGSALLESFMACAHLIVRLVMLIFLGAFSSLQHTSLPRTVFLHISQRH